MVQMDFIDRFYENFTFKSYKVREKNKSFAEFYSRDQSCLENSVGLMSLGAVGGAYLALIRGMVTPPPTTRFLMFGHGLARYILPGAFGGAVFGASICLLNESCKKYPVSNGAIAGALAGMAVGAKFHNPKTFGMSIWFGTVLGFAVCAAQNFDEFSQGFMRQKPFIRDIDVARIRHLGPQRDAACDAVRD